MSDVEILGDVLQQIVVNAVTASISLSSVEEGH